MQITSEQKCEEYIIKLIKLASLLMTPFLRRER